MTVRELYEKRAAAWDAAKTFLDTRRTENGTLSAEDAETYGRMESEINALTDEIGRLERLAETEKILRRPVGEPLTEKPGNALPGTDEPRGRASARYVKDMLAAMRTGFRQVSAELSEQTDQSGGYLVPDEWDRRLVDVLNDENIMRGLGTRITTSGEHRINIAATKPAASWIEEGGALTFGDAAFEQKTLDAHKLHVAVKVTEELLYDNAFNLEGYIIEQFGRAMGGAEEDAFLNGDGSGRPAGIFDKTAGGKYSVEIASEKITADDILTLIYTLRRPYRRRASFIMNDATLASVRKLKDGNGAYIWQPSYREGEPDRICGYTAHTSAFAPKLEAGKGGIAFGDYGYYNIGDRGTRSLQLLRELFAGNGMVGFVCKERVDGLLILPEAVQILSVRAA